MQRVVRLLKAMGARAAGFSPGTGGIIDGLLQTFENCRAGLPDETTRAGSAAVEGYFTEIYEKERPRLVEGLRAQSLYLSEGARAELVERVDDRIHQVVIPAYCRITGPFTLRERNDFFLVPQAWHALERVGWAVAGMLLGAFVVWAPFIPLWEKEWVLVFMLGGFLLPPLRRYFAFKRYEGELNRLATRTEEEITRLDMALLAGGAAPPVAPADERAIHEDGVARPSSSSSRRSGRKEGA